MACLNETVSETLEARQPITRLVVDQAYDELPDIGAVEQHVDRDWELLEPFDDGLERLQLASRDGAQGPSGPAVFVDFAGTLRLAYHAWTGAVGYPAGNRSLFIDTLGFQADKPVLQ